MSERIRAKKSLGQNFLTDPNIQQKIVAAIEPQTTDVVIEIGPGLGALTAHLVGSVARVIAIELDDRLADQLQQRYAGRTDFQLVHRDVLTVTAAQLDLPDRYQVIGNIPYNITTPLIFHLFDFEPRPTQLVLMVQKEVAGRIVAEPGSREYGALSVGVQSLARAERLFTVGRGAFRPSPNVDSAVVRLAPFHPGQLSTAEERDLRELTRTTFSQRRKQLQNILRHAPGYAIGPLEVKSIENATGLDLADRPEDLSPRQFIELARYLRAQGLMKDAA
jgi:16S rRNA (adenine1518-N6/adenine1519-N6)-dimethyltransferase